LNGQPAGFGRLAAQWIGYLSAEQCCQNFEPTRVLDAITPRLEDARDKGYHVVAIQAEPLSRPIVTRCGFKEYARSYIYGWMPVIDVR